MAREEEQQQQPPHAAGSSQHEWGFSVLAVILDWIQSKSPQNHKDSSSLWEARLGCPLIKSASRIVGPTCRWGGCKDGFLFGKRPLPTSLSPDLGCWGQIKAKGGPPEALLGAFGLGSRSRPNDRGGGHFHQKE